MNYREKDIKDVKEAMETLIRVCNGGSDRDLRATVSQVLGCEHRTLQQCFMRNVVVASIEHFAERHDEGAFDLRNQATCELASELKKVTDEKGLPLI